MMHRVMETDAIPVHLTNPEDISIRKTEEHEPEHFSFSTVVVASNTSGYNNYEQVVALDPLRKDWSITAIDNPVVLCHSHSQITDPANQVAGVPFPQGAILPAGQSFTFTGTGPAWVVATVTAASRVSIAVNRRNA